MQNKTLQEILQLLQENFSRTNERVFIKVIFSLKSRESKFGNSNIGFSRKEYLDFGVSESQLQDIILFLRDYGIIKKVGTRKINPKDPTEFKYCNLYKIADFFLEMLKELEFFSKKVFEYINPIVFMQKYFNAKFKNGIYTFKHNGNKYIIQTKGDFRNKIYGISENQIINPFLLIT